MELPIIESVLIHRVIMEKGNGRIVKIMNTFMPGIPFIRLKISGIQLAVYNRKYNDFPMKILG